MLLWVAIARTGIVHYGIRATDRRHAESMTALKALIEGQAQTNATLAEATTDALPDSEFHERRNPVGRMFRRFKDWRRLAATVVLPPHFPVARPGSGTDSTRFGHMRDIARSGGRRPGLFHGRKPAFSRGGLQAEGSGGSPEGPQRREVAAKS